MSTGGDFAPGEPAIRFAAIVDAGGAIVADSSPPSRSAWWLLAATPAIVLLTHYVAVLPHEFGHSFMAWITGVKFDPWDIGWGDGSVGDIPLLRGIDENVDYERALSLG
jgi:hypothetical protein